MKGDSFDDLLARAVRAEVESLDVTQEETRTALREVRARVATQLETSRPSRWKRLALIASIVAAAFVFLSVVTTQTALGRVVLEYFQSVTKRGVNPVITIEEGQRPVVPPPEPPPSSTEEKTPDIKQIARRVPFPVMVPTELPPGTVLRQAEVEEPHEGKTILWLRFENDTHWLQFMQVNSLGEFGASHNFDGDRYSVETVKVGSNEGILAVPKEPSAPSVLIWAAEGMRYQLSGNVDSKTLVMIGLSLKKVEP